MEGSDGDDAYSPPTDVLCNLHIESGSKQFIRWQSVRDPSPPGGAQCRQWPMQDATQPSICLVLGRSFGVDTPDDRSQDRFHFMILGAQALTATDITGNAILTYNWVIGDALPDTSWLHLSGLQPQLF